MTDRIALLRRYGGIWQYLRGGDGDLSNAAPPILRDGVPLDGSVDIGAYASKDDVTNNLVGHYGLDDMVVSEGGNLTISGGAEVISNTIFKRRISITGNQKILQNCVTLGSLTENTACITFGSAASNNTLRDVTVFAQAPRWATQGIKLGQGKVTIDRAHIYGVIDGVAPSDNWVGGLKMTRSVVEDLLLFSPDPGARGGTWDNAGHVDGVQNAGGTTELISNVFRGTYDMTQYQANEHRIDFGDLELNPDNGRMEHRYHYFGNKYRDTSGKPSKYQTSVLMASPATYPLPLTRFNYNRVDGTSYALNIPHTTLPAGAIFEVIGNIVGKDHYAGAANTYKLFICNSTVKNQMTVSGNVAADDGHALTVTDLWQTG